MYNSHIYATHGIIKAYENFFGGLSVVPYYIKNLQIFAD